MFLIQLLPTLNALNKLKCLSLKKVNPNPIEGKIIKCFKKLNLEDVFSVLDKHVLLSISTCTTTRFQIHGFAILIGASLLLFHFPGK